jgi:hypothetical protein
MIICFLIGDLAQMTLNLTVPVGNIDAFLAGLRPMRMFFDGEATNFYLLNFEIKPGPAGLEFIFIFLILL